MADQGGRSKRVLIIDDDATLVHALEERLTKEGVEVHVCSFGEQGVSDARSFRPDLIILDVMMPGIHGIQVLSDLRRLPEFNKTRVIVVSGMLDQENEEKILSLNAEFLSKSGDPQGLVARIKRYLGVL